MAQTPPTQKEKKGDNPAIPNDTGGLNAQPDSEVGTGKTTAEIKEQAKKDLDLSKLLRLEILIATDRFVKVKVPFPFVFALGIRTDAELDAAITRLAVGDEIKEFKPRATTEEGAAPAEKKKAGLPSGTFRGKQIGTKYCVQLKEPIGRKRKGLTLDQYRVSCRMPSYVGVAAFSLFLFKFAPEEYRPLFFTVGNSYRENDIEDATSKLTKVDKTGI